MSHLRPAVSAGQRRLADCLALFVLLVPSLAAIATGLNAGEFWWTDEARHAMNSVFIYDFLREGLSQSPMDYALRYFAQYPALALNWYPPGFYMVEGAFFEILGTSEFTGRLTVLALFATGLVVWYFWVSRIWGRTAAILSGLLFAFNPQVVLWTRSLMLDTPATMMVIVSIVLFDRYVEKPAWSTSIVAGLSVAGTLLVKQTTIFLLPVLFFYAILSRNGSLLLRRQAAPAMLLVALGITFVAVHALKFGDTAVAGILGQLPTDGPPKLSVERWLVHPKAVADVVGWPFLVCTLLGIAATLMPKTRNRRDAILLLWIAFWYVTTTILVGPGNSARYVIYALPALALLAARSLDVLEPPPLKLGAVAILLVALVPQILKAYQTEPRFVAGYREAAEHILRSQDRGTVLFAGKHDGNFVFHTRLGDPDRKKIILRADKLLVSMSVHKKWGVRSHVDDLQDISRLLDRHHVKYVVIERPDIVGLKEFGMLAEVAGGSDFRLERSIPVKTNVPEYQGLTINIYRRLTSALPDGDGVEVAVPVMGREVRLPLR